MRPDLAGIAVRLMAAAGCALLAACGGPDAPGPARAILEIEDARAADASGLLDWLGSDDVEAQRLAVRALGRLEQPEHGTAVLAMAGSPSPAVRREVANALGQMGGALDLTAWLERETDGAVRHALYRAIGRMPLIDGVTEASLVDGLTDPDATARLGAAHGLEAVLRLNRRRVEAGPSTLDALRRATHDDVTPVRELALLALAAAGDRDPETLDRALTDTEPQVRRLAVMASGRWIDDASPIVRYDALRVAATCARAQAALDDPSGHVRLLAIDLLGTLPCAATTIEPLVAPDQPWRVRAHAVVAQARIAPDAASPHVATLAADPIWQVRTYAARAARLIGAESVRAELATDPDPNVVIAAMTEPAEAILALERSHRGLLIAAADLLEGSSELNAAAPALVTAFLRLSGEDRPTSRDARLALLARLAEVALDRAGATAVAEALRPWLEDRDPVIASRVADVLSAATGTAVEPVTTAYADASLPSDEFIRGLEGAAADVTMTGLGTFTIELLTEEAPATVGRFARHAEAGGYDGTTFHRVVPNFVLQGGSPGAHEMDGAVGPYMRDELGLTMHLRGTLGISTRGRDTGDGQIFVNLVDNFRLDHEYTVWARVVAGMDVVDRILEGDVIESVRIRRR